NQKKAEQKVRGQSATGSVHGVLQVRIESRADANIRNGNVKAPESARLPVDAPTHSTACGNRTQISRPITRRPADGLAPGSKSAGRTRVTGSTERQNQSQKGPLQAVDP